MRHTIVQQYVRHDFSIEYTIQRQQRWRTLWHDGHSNFIQFDESALEQSLFLPSPVKVAQQPQTQPIAVYEATKDYEVNEIDSHRLDGLRKVVVVFE